MSDTPRAKRCDSLTEFTQRLDSCTQEIDDDAVVSETPRAKMCDTLTEFTQRLDSCTQKVDDDVVVSRCVASTNGMLLTVKQANAVVRGITSPPGTSGHKAV